MRCRLSKWVLLSVATAASLARVWAQSTTSAMVLQRPVFEVASVREDKSGGPARSNIPLDRGDVYSATGGILSATDQSVVTLLIFAYKINISEFLCGLMRSLPGWATSDQFDIQARAASAQPTKDEMRLMMQSLLEDRFRLRVHREQRTMPVDGLHLRRAGRMGAQLKAHDAGSSCAGVLPQPEAGTPVAAMVGMWPTLCGDGAEVRVPKDRVHEGGRDMTMSAIADWLTGTRDSERPFVDRTGLKGRFDFVLEFDPESLGREGISSLPREDAGPTLVEAMREQLGLEFRKEDGAVGIFVVDRIEYPTAN